MAEELHNADIKDDVSVCYLCRDNFQDPRLLDCYHTFCFKCIKTYLDIKNRAGVFNCPLCKMEMKVPIIGAMGLAKNYYTESENDDLRLKTKCDICQEKTPVMSHCYQCSQNLCSSCVTYHSKVESTKDHTIEEIAEPDRPKDRSYTRCFMHNNEMRYYCEECRELICLDCNMTTHKLHTSKEMTEAAVSYREELAKEIQNGEYKSHLMALNEGNKKEQFDKQKVIDQLDKQKAYFQKYLEVIHNDIVKQLKDDDSTTNSEVEDGIKGKSKIDTKLKSFADVYFLTCQMLDRADDSVIAQHGAKLIERLRQMKSDDQKLRAMKVRSMSFEPGSLNKQLLLKMFGKLVLTEKP